MECLARLPGLAGRRHHPTSPQNCLCARPALSALGTAAASARREPAPHSPGRPVRAGRLHAPGTHPRAHDGPAWAAYLPMMTTGPAAEVAMPAPDCPKAPRAPAEVAAPGAALCRSCRGRTVTHAHWLRAKPGRGAGSDWLGQDQGAGALPRDPLGAAMGGASTS